MTAPVDFRPSDVVIREVPFIGAFGRAEFEVAAACLVHAMASDGDTWHPVTWADALSVALTDAERGRDPWPSITRNPFLNPDLSGLVLREFVRLVATTPPAPVAYEFTDAGLAALRRWVRPAH